jgi:undecaprenyl-diphosphatase
MLDDRHLFELINAAPDLHGLRLVLATALAQYLVFALAAGMVVAWVRGSREDRYGLLRALYACLIALALAQLIGWLWPRPRPFALHLGQQFMPHANDAGLPSDHVTVFWTLGLAALATRQFATWGFPLLAAGLAVGWSRVYLGVHFPLDVLAALPVAALALALASALGKFADARFSKPVVDIYARFERRLWRRRNPHNGEC